MQASQFHWLPAETAGLHYAASDWCRWTPGHVLLKKDVPDCKFNYRLKLHPTVMNSTVYKYSFT